MRTLFAFFFRRDPLAEALEAAHAQAAADAREMARLRSERDQYRARAQRAEEELAAHKYRTEAWRAEVARA